MGQLAQNLAEFVQGLWVTILGMGLVFAALGLLMLIIAGLQRVFRPEEAPLANLALATASAGAVGGTATVAQGAREAEPEGEPPEEVAAAIAVAIVVLRQRAQAPQTTVVTFAPGTSAWRALGRLS